MAKMSEATKRKLRAFSKLSEKEKSKRRAAKSRKARAAAKKRPRHKSGSKKGQFK